MFDIPKPRLVAKDMPEEVKHSLPPLDLMIQYVMPRLIDKCNMAEWNVARLENELAEMRSSLSLDIAETRDMIKARKPRAKKPKGEAPAVGCDVDEPVSMADIGVYNPDTDQWEPRIINGAYMTGRVVREIRESPEAPLSASPDMVAFAKGLSDSAYRMLVETFK